MNQNPLSSLVFPERQLAPVTDRSEMGEREHFVQFYESDAFLVHSLSAFIAAGLRAGEAAIVIATPAHREALERELQLRSLDPAALQTCEQYFPLDAAETLSTFMVDAEPDKSRFLQTVSPLLLRAAQGGRRVRAFGEM